MNSASEIAGKLLREVHVATVPGEGFGTKEHIRISYATRWPNSTAALERMRKFFGGLLSIARFVSGSSQFPRIYSVRLPAAMTQLYPLLHVARLRPATLGHARSLCHLPNHKFNERIGEAWLTGDNCVVANGPLAKRSLGRPEQRIRRRISGYGRARSRSVFRCC